MFIRCFCFLCVLGVSTAEVSGQSAPTSTSQGKSSWIQTGEKLFQVNKEDKSGSLSFSCCFNPDGTLLAYLLQGNVHVVDSSGTEIQKIADCDAEEAKQFSTYGAQHLRFSPDGTFLWVVSHKALHLFSTGSWRRILRTELLPTTRSYQLGSVAINPKLDFATLAEDMKAGKGVGQQLVAAYYLSEGAGKDESGVYGLYDNGTSRRLWKDGPWPLAFHPDGKVLIIQNQNARLMAYDLTSGASKTLADMQRRGINAITFSPDGKLMAVSASSARSNGIVRLMRAENNSAFGRMVKTIDTGIYEVKCLGFTHDSQYLVVSATRERGMGIFDRSGKQVARFSPDQHSPFALHSEELTMARLVKGSDDYNRRLLFEDLSTYLTKIPTSTRAGSR